MKFTGTVKNGLLILHDKESFNRYIKDIDSDVWIDVKFAPKTRSSQQNAYYRTIIREIGNFLGYNEDEMHDVMKAKFQVKSTKDLSQEDFSDFLDRIIRFAATLGYAVKDPRKSS